MSWGKYRKAQNFFCSNRKRKRSYKYPSARFMACSLSNLVDNLAEGIHKIKCKDCDCFLKYESIKDNLIKYK